VSGCSDFPHVRKEGAGFLLSFANSQGSSAFYAQQWQSGEIAPGEYLMTQLSGVVSEDAGYTSTTPTVVAFLSQSNPGGGSAFTAAAPTLSQGQLGMVTGANQVKITIASNGRNGFWVGWFDPSAKTSTCTIILTPLCE
jgi:hypothetical protein